MTDQEIICKFMGWVLDAGRCQVCGWPYADFAHMVSALPTLSLDRLREVQERLTEEQWIDYAREFAHEFIPLTDNVIWFDEYKILLNASPEQKIKALAVVLRPVVEGGAK